MSISLLTRKDCGLCEDAAMYLRRLGCRFETVDIDNDAVLLARFNEAIPVVLVDGREVSRAPMTEQGLRAALAGAGLTVRG